MSGPRGPEAPPTCVNVVERDARRLHLSVRPASANGRELVYSIGACYLWIGSISALCLSPGASSGEKTFLIIISGLSLMAAIVFLRSAAVDRWGKADLRLQQGVLTYERSIFGHTTRRRLLKLDQVKSIIFSPTSKMVVSAGPWPVLRKASIAIQLINGRKLPLFEDFHLSEESLQWLATCLQAALSGA